MNRSKGLVALLGIASWLAQPVLCAAGTLERASVTDAKFTQQLGSRAAAIRVLFELRAELRSGQIELDELTRSKAEMLARIRQLCRRHSVNVESVADSQFEAFGKSITSQGRQDRYYINRDRSYAAPYNPEFGTFVTELLKQLWEETNWTRDSFASNLDQDITNLGRTLHSIEKLQFKLGLIRADYAEAQRLLEWLRD